MQNLKLILEERKARYGDFKDHSTISQELKNYLRVTPKWDKLSDDKKEALDMIVHKIARILNGDPEYKDSWDDIAGYATRVGEYLND